ncbi:MAG: nitroreductase family protein [Deltaproteobacteria bacterium]|nr:nitroreductase family protein [Deltaproteobacteria bacterium]MBW2136945.1 nitroreductase family protein [Deltaproteobacteria bacterium]
MDFYEVNEKRRTIRKFKAPAGEEQLRKLITEGTKAPSSRNTQGWEFVMVDDPNLIEEISEIKYVLTRDNKPRGEPVPTELEVAAQRQKETFANASIVLVYHPEGAGHAAGAWCCIQNMLLAAVAEGLGSKISYFRGEATERINRLVKAPEGVTLAAAIHFGVPAEDPGPRSLRPEGSWLHRNRF